jgi:excinuclease UvrABC ATPase subunit
MSPAAAARNAKAMANCRSTCNSCPTSPWSAPNVPRPSLSPQVLEVTVSGKNIDEVLQLTVREAFLFFRHQPPIQHRLKPLMDVGFDYLTLGQGAPTLSAR